jgi:preprotein translocase subunit SecY
MPYISASIIMQLMTAVSPQLDQLRKEGESGRRKITQYTRYGTVFLALFQATGISIALESQPGLVLDPGLMFRLTTITSLVTGTMFLMWLGEQITERGQRKILVNYAKRQVGNRVYGGQSSHLPFKLNMSGVIPPIFASSLILFPATLLGWFGSAEGLLWLRDIAGTLTPGQPIYVLMYGALIVFFCFFYTALQYNPKETADNLKKSGAFVPGIRPGDQTARYLEKILTRLTLAGAVYVTAVCLLPEFLILRWNVPFYFGGTSLLIIVVVTMDFMAQVQAYIMTHQYESLLRKANFKGGLPVR